MVIITAIYKLRLGKLAQNEKQALTKELPKHFKSAETKVSRYEQM